MDKNKMIIVDGVHYELLPADSEQLQQISSRAIVVKDEKAPQVTSVATAKPNMTPEKLTDDVVRRLIGHTNVLYYNFEINAWNTNRFDICKVPDKTDIINEVKQFKAVMEAAFEFDNQYEIVAPVTMSMDTTAYSGYGKKVSNPKYNRTGKTVAGNIIVRNKETGRYELYCKYWVGGRCLVVCQDNADIYGTYYFVHDGIFGHVFRAALLVAHER